MERAVRLNVSPRQCLIDQPFRIFAENLQPGNAYTITAFCKVPEIPDGFQAHAFYVADDMGKIDLDTSPSRGGSFIGVESMGLMWSMKNLNENEYLRNVYELRLQEQATSYEVIFLLYAGHDKPPMTSDFAEKVSNISVIAQAVIERLVCSANVLCVQVREGRLRGVLFIPPGDGPFQGVLDIFSIPPRKIFTQRARLLASRGFVVFAAGCTDYEGSPDIDHLELEYFLECVEWLHSLPKVTKSGIAITGTCYGGTIALYLAMLSTRVKGVVTINACSYFIENLMRYERKQLPMYADYSKIKKKAGDIYSDWSQVYPVIENLAVPVEKSASDVRFLLISGEDDKVITTDHARHLAHRLKQGARHKFKLSTYPQVGHIVTQPYTLVVSAAPVTLTAPRDDQYHSGGQTCAQARAQENIWKEILQFLTDLPNRSKI